MVQTVSINMTEITYGGVVMLVEFVKFLLIIAGLAWMDVKSKETAVK